MKPIQRKMHQIQVTNKIYTNFIRISIIHYIFLFSKTKSRLFILYSFIRNEKFENKNFEKKLRK
jgi:hypothetical protein